MNKDSGIEVKGYKLKALPATPICNAVLFIKADTDIEATPYVTDVNGVPYPLKGSGGIITVTNTDGTIVVTGSNNIIINLSTAIKNLINSALQSGDNISELVNDAGYITAAEVPPTVTNLQSIASPTNVVINNDNGTDATILAATSTNAGVLLPGDKVKLDNTTNVNSGDQTSIAGISGTKVDYNTSLTDGDFLFVGDKTSNLINDGSDATSTYVESDELGVVAFSNNYNDLDNLPIIVGSTNLSYTASSTNGTVNSDTGTDADIPLVDLTNAGLISPSDKVKLDNTSGVNSGDNAVNTTSNAYADSKVAQTIINGVTNSAPSQDAVFDAINALIPPSFSNIVYVNSNDPNTATIFDLNNPPTVNDNTLKSNVNNLYVGLNGSIWTYNSTALLYTTYVPSGGNGSNFYLSGTAVDAGNNKVAAIKRNGTIETTGNKVTGGLASQFQKGDGSLDNTVYENSTNKSNSLADVSSTTKFPAWNIIITWIKENFITALPAKSSILIDADFLVIGDSADSNKTKTRTWAQIKSNLASIFFLDATSSIQTQIDGKQVVDNQIEIAVNSNVLNAWHGQTILFTSNCTITVPSSLNNQLMFPFTTLPGVTVTWAITTPFTWQTTPSPTPENTPGHFMRRGSTNTIILYT